MQKKYYVIMHELLTAQHSRQCEKISPNCQWVYQVKKIPENQTEEVTIQANWNSIPNFEIPKLTTSICTTFRQHPLFRNLRWIVDSNSECS